jgi:hypothetical protein
MTATLETTAEDRGSGQESPHRKFKRDRDVRPWKGGYLPYDIVKEGAIALLVVAVLVVGLALLFGSPDAPPVTLRSWSNHDPVDFAQTAITELDRSSGTATYGPPYTTWQPGESQKLGPVSLERLFGVHHPVNTTSDFVVGPLRSQSNNPQLTAALDEWQSATPEQRQAWTAAYEDAAKHATFREGRLVVPHGAYGPVATMVAELTTMARSGALDANLVTGDSLYSTDYTKPLLFIADGQYMENLATSQNLTGSQWGMMNEAGNYPGQAWLWLYTLWYQVPPMNSSDNGDVEVWAIMAVLTLALIFLPFIPGLRSIPRWVPVYRLVWRRHYAASATPGATVDGRGPPD